jgi:hypothetical protein
MMIRICSLILFFWTGLIGSCGISIAAPADLPPRPTEMSSIDFEDQWKPTSDPSFPKEALKAFPKDTQIYLRDLPGVSLNFVFVDLNWDGTKEIIVADPSASGSGGQAYFVLRRVGKTWKLIGGFQGGFILSVRDALVEYKGDFYRITTYYRSGDTYQNTYDFRNGRYVGTGQVMIPKVITDSCWWDPFWARLNGFSGHDRSGGKYDHRHEAAGPCRDRTFR